MTRSFFFNSCQSVRRNRQHYLLDAIGIEPLDPSSLHLMRGDSGRHRTPSCPPHDKRQLALALHLARWARESPILLIPWGILELEVLASSAVKIGLMCLVPIRPSKVSKSPYLTYPNPYCSIPPLIKYVPAILKSILLHTYLNQICTYHTEIYTVPYLP